MSRSRSPSGNNAAPRKRRGRPEKYTLVQVREALQHAKGLTESAARVLGCDADTVRAYQRRYPELKAVQVAEKEVLKDLAELKLVSLIASGNLGAICFFLKTQAKDRGYVERQEMTGASGGPVQIEPVRIYLPTSGREVTHRHQGDGDA